MEPTVVMFRLCGMVWAPLDDFCHVLWFLVDGQCSDDAACGRWSLGFEEHGAGLGHLYVQLLQHGRVGPGGGFGFPALLLKVDLEAERLH